MGFTCNQKQLFWKHIHPSYFPRLSYNCKLCTIKFITCFLYSASSRCLKNIINTDLSEDVETLRLSPSHSPNAKETWGLTSFRKVLSMHLHSFLISAHPSHTRLMGMTLGKSVHPQGEIVELGTGSRDGMSPAGDEGTMGVVKIFLSLWELLCNHTPQGNLYSIQSLSKCQWYFSQT